ncbi:MAG: alpha/beta fold hydrolase, partial [Clostridiales bacterium]|nr:alpha/beta fold hydrolase [Clostridiales bacterium]
MKFDTIKKKTAFLLVISLILMLLCGIVVSAVQTKGGKVSMKEMTIETDSGYAMSAILFVPDTATKENPAPAIVVSHGYLNNKEMTDANFVELARRGYVVLTVDQPNHGNSEVVEDVNSVYFDGIYQGVLAVSRMPFVDTTKIGVTGHSMGAYSCNAAVMADNAADTQLISAVLLNCNDPLATDGDGNYLNLYGSRDVGIISVVYDEFFGKSIAEDGSVLQSPYWLESDAAQSFLNFGKDPSDCESREAYTEYYEGVDGTDAFHVIYRPSITHPWSHFSKKSVSCVVGFFEDSLGAPNPIGSSNQIWQVKEAFNAVGLIGFVLFICSFGGMLLYTRTFESLRPKEELLIPGKPVEGKASTAWFWLSLVAGVIFGSITYLPVMAKGTSLKTAQIMSMGIGLWAVICAAYSVGFMLIYYYTFGKKHGKDPKEVGIRVP